VDGVGSNGSDGVLTNVDNVIQGKGDVGGNSLQVINEPDGLIDANGDQALTLNPRPSDPMINMGIMRASSGGNLVLTGNALGSFDNTGGLIEALDASTVTLISGVSVVGGTLQTSGSGTIEVPTSTAAGLADVTIDGVLNVRNNSDLYLGGTITNAGNTINILNTSNSTNIFVDTAVSLDGGGTVTLGGSSTTSRIVDGVGSDGSDGVLTNVDNVIQGKGDIGGNTLQVINEPNGLIDANADQALTLNPRPSNPMINRGTMQASAGGNLVLTGNGNGSFDNTAGLIEALDASTVTFASGGSISGGVLKTSGSGTIQVLPSNVGAMADLTIDGTVVVNNNSDLYFGGTIENLGSVNVIGASNTTEIIVNSPVVVTGPGSINLQGSAGLSKINGSGDIEIVGGSVNGIGSVNVPILFNNATVSPGNSVGTLTFTAATQVVNGSVLDIEINAVSGSPGVNWDYVNVNGTLDFADDLLESGARVKLKSLDPNGMPGFLDGFDQGQDYTWQIGNATTIEGFSSNFVIVDTSEFANTFCGIFTVTQKGSQLLLNYVSQVLSVNADGVFALRGFLFDGTVENTFESDDEYLQYNPGFTINSSEPPVWLEFEGTLPDSVPQWLNVKLESHANTINIRQQIEMYNWLTETYQLVDARQTSFNVDATANVAVALPMEFVEAGTNRVKARLGWKSNGFVLLYPWRVSIDYVVWLLQ
jgi:hypothetical protein